MFPGLCFPLLPQLALEAPALQRRWQRSRRRRLAPVLETPEVVVRGPCRTGEGLGGGGFKRVFQGLRGTGPSPRPGTHLHGPEAGTMLRLISLAKAKGDMTTFNQVKSATKTRGVSCSPDPQ